MSLSRGGAEAENKSPAIVFTSLQSCLILTFPARLTSALSAQIESETLARCASGRQTSILFDLSALEMVDLTEWRWLRKVAREVYLLGAQTWFVGVNPALIATLIMLDAEIDGVNYALGVEEALEEVSQRALAVHTRGRR